MCIPAAPPVTTYCNENCSLSFSTSLMLGTAVVVHIHITTSHTQFDTLTWLEGQHAVLQDECSDTDVLGEGGEVPGHSTPH